MNEEHNEWTFVEAPAGSQSQNKHSSRSSRRSEVRRHHTRGSVTADKATEQTVGNETTISPEASHTPTPPPPPPLEAAMFEIVRSTQLLDPRPTTSEIESTEYQSRTDAPPPSVAIDHFWTRFVHPDRPSDAARKEALISTAFLNIARLVMRPTSTDADESEKSSRTKDNAEPTSSEAPKISEPTVPTQQHFTFHFSHSTTTETKSSPSTSADETTPQRAGTSEAKGQPESDRISEMHRKLHETSVAQAKMTHELHRGRFTTTSSFAFSSSSSPSSTSGSPASSERETENDWHRRIHEDAKLRCEELLKAHMALHSVDGK